ncbi:MAG: zinc-ribbon domain-containing protein [Gammaproteobacteria bacterium]
MPLINCPDCEAEISSNAQTCIKCGAPIAQAYEQNAAGVPLLTIQETSKKLKLQIVLSSLLFWIGLLALMMVVAAEEEPVLSSMAIAVGLIWYLITRIRIWWHHK